LSVEKVIKVCQLGDDVTATVTDITSHYFGGYYHVRIQVRANVPVTAALFETAADYDDAVVRLGSSIVFNRILEKMAVPDVEIDAVRQHLLAAFEENVLPYLIRDDFASGFVRSEYHKKIKSVPLFPGRYA
jgi:hypothetical protein